MVYVSFSALCVSAASIFGLVQAATPPVCNSINYTSPYAPLNANRSIWTLNVTSFRTEHSVKGGYNKSWDLSDLPTYQPQDLLNGTLRIWGSNYLKDGQLGQYWQETFNKFQPGIKIEYNLPTTAIGIPALAVKAADLGVGRPATLMDYLTYQQVFGHDPVEIVAATGSYDVYGWSPAFAIVVREDNPLENITMKELDGVFGTARGGGYNRSTWMTSYPYKRGPEYNIRTWGQLGLKGEWVNAPIHPCGQTTKANIQDVFQNLVLWGSNQWVEGLRTFANYAMTNNTLATWSKQVLAAGNADPYSICVGSPEVVGPGMKELAVQAFNGGPYVKRSLETIRAREYPLYNEIFFFANKEAGEPMEPMVYEFLKFILSQEGQDQVQREGRYLPLPGSVVNKMLKKIEPSA
ncbi:unnamed protein product [Clonostachys chloroleuca]|uniref:PBP domain-containing protein n=1 Tax=Clonostachys chloroleuca TaxID=1926264 RepID=A0AA35LWP9_9HYPO|nr:unnamed protein product [Clonostachys chloroleuca]